MFGRKGGRLFRKSFSRKALGFIVVGLFLTNILALDLTIQPVSALTGLTLKWRTALGLYAETYVCPLAADLNRDGKMEVVVVGGSSDGGTDGTVTVLDGATGRIVWQVGPANGSAYSGIGQHTPFEIADLDGDGIPEIIVAAVGGVLALHGNNGSVYWRNNVPPEENYFSVFDIDGDGHPEIFVNRGNGPYNGYDRLTVLDYMGNILRQAWDWHPCWGGITVGDPNNDGHFKLFQGDRSTYYSARTDPYKGGGQGVRCLDAFTLTPIWNDPTILCSTQVPMLANVDNNPNGTLAVVVADQGDDGIAVLNATDGTVLTTRYATDGTLLSPVYRKAALNIPSHSNPTIADVDGDGHLEMIICHDSAVYIWDLYDWVLKAVLPAPASVFEPPKVGNVTGGSNPDIIVVMGSDIYIYNYANGNFSQVQHIVAPMWGGSAFTLVQDVDGDGNNELIVTGTSGIVLCYDCYDNNSNPVKSPTPRVRSTNQFYSLNRCGSAEYVPPPIPSKPVLRNENPIDSSVNQGLNPTLSVLATDFQGYNMNITLSTNTTVLASYKNVPNGVYNAPTTKMNSPGSTYYWTVNATDGKSTSSNTYKFTTYSNPPPQNNVSSANLYLPFSTSTSNNPLVADALFGDGFESGLGNWTGNGATKWDSNTSQEHSGSYSAHATLGSGYLTSNSLDTSSSEGITVSFWYYDHGVGTGDNVYLRFWNGSAYNDIFHLGNTVPENQWHLFSYQTYDRQYLNPSFRIRLDAASIKSTAEGIWVDDISVTAPSRTLDYSGQHNDGTVHSATWTSLGVVGGAYVFDGVNDYIRVQDDPSLGGDGTWGEITIDFWINPMAQQNGATMIAKKVASATTGSYMVRFASSGPANILSWGINSTTDGAWHEINSSNTALAPGQWYHVVCTYKSGTGLAIYINSILAASSPTPFTGNIAPGQGVSVFGQPLFIGYDGGSGRTGLDTQKGWLNGVLDEVKIYPLALTPLGQWKLTVSSDHDSPNPGVGDSLYSDGQSVTCSVASTVTEGNNVYTCTGWTGTGSVPSSGSGTSVTFTITRDSSITWNWIVTPSGLYNLTIGVIGNGATTPIPNTYSYSGGTNVSVTAVPDSGWMLNNWLLNGSDVGSTNPYNLTMSDNWNLTAVFIHPVFADGFESGDISKWDGVSQSVGTASVVPVPVQANTLPFLGGYVAEFKFAPSSGGGYAYVYKNVDSSEIYARGYFYVGQGLPLPAGNDRFYLIEFNDPTTYLCVLGIRKVNGVDRWVLVGKAGTPFANPIYGSPVPSTPQWISIELHLKIGTNGLLEVVVNGKIDIQISGNTSAWGNIKRAMFGIPIKSGPPGAPSTYAMDVYVDQCVIATEYIEA